MLELGHQNHASNSASNMYRYGEVKPFFLQEAEKEAKEL